jgi:hypothetical protein
MNNMCAINPNPTLCQFEVSRRPVLARKMGYVQAVEHPQKKEVPALDYKDTAAAKMEAERQPRRVARLKKLKNLNVDTK